jgi:hypothetical protein
MSSDSKKTAGDPACCHEDHAKIASPVAPSKTGKEYTCPMHPEIRQDHPGACPICGMALSSVSVIGNSLRLRNAIK